MADNEIFWLGGKPGSGARGPKLAEGEQFVQAIRTACEDLGCEFQRLVSAEGPYGTWLVEYNRDGQNQRVVWNGKDEIMVLQQERPNGGWDEPRELEVEQRDVAGFSAAVRKILTDDSA